MTEDDRLAHLSKKDYDELAEKVIKHKEIKTTEERNFARFVLAVLRTLIFPRKSDHDCLEKLAAETLATWMHHQYQRIAQEEGWQVQSNTAGEFADLPEANKRVMVRMAADVRKLLIPAAHAAGRIEGLEEAAKLADARAKHWHEQGMQYWERMATSRASRDLAHLSEGAEEIAQVIRSRIRELEGKA